MKSYSTLVHEFFAGQSKELEALFVVLDWVKNIQKKNPNNLIVKEWLNATELTITTIYDNAFSALKDHGIAYHSGSDTTEAPPEVIRRIYDDLSKYNCSPFAKIESLNNYYIGKPSTSSESNDTCSDLVNFMYFGPAHRIAERNSSAEDVPFGFQFPHSMHFNFRDKRQETSANLVNSTSSLSCHSAQALFDITLNESEQKEIFPPFSTMYFAQPTKDEKPSLQIQESIKSEITEIYDSNHLDLTEYVDSSLESQNSNPPIEFFRISSEFIPTPKNSEIAKRHCTSSFCFCSFVKASYKNEPNDDSLEDDDDISDIEPYLEVENINFPNLELPDLLDDTPESFLLLQPCNTLNNTEESETSDESVKDTSFSSLSILGTPKNNPENEELMLQHFNTPVTPGNISESSNMDTSMNDSLGVAELDFDDDIDTILPEKCLLDNDHENVRQEGLRSLFSYKKSRLTEQKKHDENDTELNDNIHFATSTPNRRYCDSSKDC